MLAGSSGQTKELGPWYRQPPRMPTLQGQDSWWHGPEATTSVFVPAGTKGTAGLNNPISHFPKYQMLAPGHLPNTRSSQQPREVSWLGVAILV